MGVVKPARRTVPQVGPKYGQTPGDRQSSNRNDAAVQCPGGEISPVTATTTSAVTPLPSHAANLPLAGHAVVVAIQVRRVGGLTTVNGGAHTGRAGCCTVPEATTLRGPGLAQVREPGPGELADWG